MPRSKKPRYVELDPNEVGVLENVRKDLGDLRPLIRSVKVLGVLVPVVVVPDPDTEGGYLIKYGQRRQAAAIAAGQPLPGIVAEDGDVDEAHRIATQMAENLFRKDLTLQEEAAGYEQLAAFDLSAPPSPRGWACPVSTCRRPGRWAQARLRPRWPSASTSTSTRPSSWPTSTATPRP